MFSWTVSRLLVAAGLIALMGVAVAPAVLGGRGVELGWGTVMVSATNGLFAARLILVALKRHFGVQTGSCYSPGFMAMGLLAAGIEGAAVSVRTTFGLAGGTHYVSLIALGVGVGTFIPGMLMLPGAVTSVLARARRGLDGLSVGACLLFVAWLLAISPRGPVGGFGFWVCTLVCCALSVAAVTGIRSGRTRPGALACAGSAAASATGSGGLTLCLADGGGTFLVATSVALLTMAPGIAWFGLRRPVAPEEPGPLEVEGTFAGYPVLALPAAAATMVALQRLLTGGAFDRTAVILGVGALGVVAVRETVAAIEVSRYARKVAQREAQFRSLVAGSTDVIMVLDGEFIVRWQSPAAARQLGLSDQEVVGRHFQSMVHPADAVLVARRLGDVRRDPGDGSRPWLVEARLRDGFGQWRETESSISDQREVPQVGGLVVHIRDVSERKEMERTVHRLSYADQLTGLANRRQLLASVAARRRVPRAPGSLLLLELDGFNAVNDVRGYDIGDAVLVEVARRLRAGVDGTELPARLSGDEFAVVTDASAVQAYALATRLLTMTADPIVLPGVTVHLSASVGLTDLAGATSADDVLRRADLALRRAKQLGRGRVEWYDAALEQAMLRRMILEQELPDALLGGQLDLIYQPILDLVAPRPLAVEALLRWRHPRLGTLLPCEVIPVAEDLGLINGIGSWVVYQAGRQLATWLREGRDLSMAVNVSPRQLADAELYRDVHSVLGLHELPPDRLVLELAEGGLGPDTGPVTEQLVQLRSLGVRTALDEFGTGPDSLTHLRCLPMDMVKIGRSFFDGPAEKPGQSVPIIDVMVGLGRRLGIDVVAQGLEAPAHLEVVRGAGCRLGQGHLFARPQPAEHVEAYLDGFPGRSG